MLFHRCILQGGLRLRLLPCAWWCILCMQTCSCRLVHYGAWRRTLGQVLNTLSFNCVDAYAFVDLRAMLQAFTISKRCSTHCAIHYLPTFGFGVCGKKDAYVSKYSGGGFTPTPGQTRPSQGRSGKARPQQATPSRALRAQGGKTSNPIQFRAPRPQSREP